MKIRRIMEVGILPMMYKFFYRFLKHDEELDSIAANNGSYRYLERYVRYLATRSEVKDMSPVSETRYVWVCWFQGEDNAPLLVRCCIESIRIHCADRKVILITDENISDYICVPDYILKKRGSGKITNTHFSDIIRIMLLNKYGGIWIDSTILLTGAIPDYILDSPFFIFRSWRTTGSVRCTTGFIASCPHHPLLEDVQTLLFEYWRKETRLITYSLIHLFITLAIDSSYENKRLWGLVPIYNYSDNELLRVALSSPFDQKRYAGIMAITPIHKLTYKFDEYHIDPHEKGTFYDFLTGGKK